MEYTKRLIVLFILIPSNIFHTICGIKQMSFTDLRRFEIEAVIGRFTVNRETLERVIQNRKEKDGVCGHDVNLQLPHSLPDSPYNTKYQGEAMFAYGNITDKGLAGDLSNDLKGQVATSYRYFDALIPVVIGNGSQGILSLSLLTDSTKKVMSPYHTTVNDITHVDSIEETDDGTVTIRLGDDVMVFRVQRDVKCDFNKKEKIGKVFDKVIGKVIPTTSYPSRFDWGCEILGSDVSFCKVLYEVRCELAAVEGDVCTLTSATSSKRCLATFLFVEMTGIFQEMLPLLAEIVPSESFEAESVERNHITGIIYPCLTPQPT